MSNALVASLQSPSTIPPAGEIGLMVVSSSQELRQELIAKLESERWSLYEVASGAEALEKIDAGTASLVLLDPNLPDLKVEEFKAIVQTQYPGVSLITVNPHTGQPIVSSPSPGPLCFEIVRRIERTVPLRQRTVRADTTGELPMQATLPEMIGTSTALMRVSSMVRLVAARDTTVLITGESGTGTDLVARATHHLSNRRSKPFVVINCAAIPEALLEAELFGFVKGAFTGAVQSRIGRIHAAQGGTLFLDEIGDLPLGLQSKLLRFLEQGEVQRLGSTDTFRVDVRVVAATNAHLRQLVQERRFREDLYYRLSIFPVELPPLRDRMEDLHPLTQSFLARFCPHNVALSGDAAELLIQHTWPGNVRELRNVIERASILVGQGHEIQPEHIVLWK